MAPRLSTPTVTWLAALALIGCGSGPSPVAADAAQDVDSPVDAAFDGGDGDVEGDAPSSDVNDAGPPEVALDTDLVTDAPPSATDADSEIAETDVTTEVSADAAPDFDSVPSTVSDATNDLDLGVADTSDTTDGPGPELPPVDPCGDCDDGDPCTEDGCVTATGVCVHLQLDCEDGDPCTFDTCDKDGLCVTLGEPVVCNMPPPASCEGGNAQYYAASGTCVAGDDGVDCAYDVLLEEVCSDPPCLLGHCEVGVGCVSGEELGYPAPSPCVTEQNTLVDCEDGNPCTMDYCASAACDPCQGDTSECPADGSAPCVHTPINCDDVNACTIDSCDPLGGDFANPCMHELVFEGCVPCIDSDEECDDGDPCTVDDCWPWLGQCHYEPVLDCDDGDPCTDDLCLLVDDAFVCEWTQDQCTCECEDGGACFDVVCNTSTGNCDYSSTGECGCAWSSDCPTWPACQVAKCVDGQCVYEGSDCDDGDPCTVEWCEPESGCGHHPATCEDLNPCTIDSCDPVFGCQHMQKDCDDGDPSTSDFCLMSDGHCLHTVDPCASDDPCLESGNWCEHIPKDCDDGNPCTDDACFQLTGQCVHLVVTCEPPDPSIPCTTTGCSPAGGGCVVLPGCDDGNVCTVDSCVQDDSGDTTCTHEPVEPCADDGNPCTEVFCHPVLGCVSDLISCPEDDDKCTEATCDAQTGCGQQPLECAPDDACHDAACDPISGCVQTPVTCEEDTLCAIFGCDPAVGCVTSNPCEDGDPCTDDLCKPDDGDCTHVTADGCP